MHSCTAPHHQCAYEPSRNDPSALGWASQYPSSTNISQNPLPQSWAIVVTDRKISRKKSIQPLPKKTLDVSPSHEPSNTCSNTMNNSMESTFDIRKKYFDQTEKLPLQSSTGHNYVFILYKYDKNEIVSVPLKH